MTPIEIIRATGSCRDAGLAIGEACADAVREDLSETGPIPAGRSSAEQLELAARYRAATATAFPWVVEECDAIAEGAGVDPLAFFASGVEEIWYEPRGCSDLVAVPPATADGHVLVGHTNDLLPAAEDRVVAIERFIDGQPPLFTIGVGPWPSVGFSGAGISFTGNELSPNDERVGIPRMMQFRAMLAQPDAEAATAVALRPERASSYNHVVVSREGHATNVEGSATDAEVMAPDPLGVLAHTNHYVCERMIPYEGDPVYARGSSIRLRRARELLEASAGSITPDSMRAMLADHEHAPDSICRHRVEAPDRSKSVFWCVCDVTDMRVWFGRGNPCERGGQEYAFG